MDQFQAALSTVLNYQPIITAALSSIGLATIFFLLWQVVRPLFSYFGSSGNHMVIFWCTILIVAGGALLGVGYDTQLGSFAGAGIGCAASGFIVLLFYWVRKWVKWVHNEKD